jgi:hypothetical protein
MNGYRHYTISDKDMLGTELIMHKSFINKIESLSLSPFCIDLDDIITSFESNPEQIEIEKTSMLYIASHKRIDEYYFIIGSLAFKIIKIQARGHSDLFALKRLYRINAKTMIKLDMLGTELTQQQIKEIIKKNSKRIG